MITRIFTLFILLFSVGSATAQKTISVSGLVRGEDGKPLPKASVSIVNIGAKDTMRTTTNKDGNYYFDKVKATKVILSITFIGYKKFSDEFEYSGDEGEHINNDIVLTAGNMLDAVTLQSSKVYIKEIGRASCRERV